MERKCENVNMTVPQRDCQQTEIIEMETKCEVTSENVTMPVCVEMVDKEVEETCEDYVPDTECFKSSCKNVTRPVFMKSCTEVLDEKCEVIIEQEMEEKCTKVEVSFFILDLLLTCYVKMVQYQEQCSRITVEECYDAEEWVCEEESQPESSYGAPKVCFESFNFVQKLLFQAPVISEQPVNSFLILNMTRVTAGKYVKL